MTTKIVEEPTLRGKTKVFRDRFQAGKLLAEKLQEYSHQENVIILVIPAGEFQWAVLLRKHSMPRWMF
jgi:hypothetical protein